MSAHYYELLGVSPGASTEEIRSAYRQRATILHPDRNPGDAQAAELFSEISRAYEVLSREELRRQYDAENLKPRSWWEELQEDARSIFSAIEKAQEVLRVDPLHKRSECPDCLGKGEIQISIGPVRIMRSCSNCEEEKPSTVSRDRA